MRRHRSRGFTLFELAIVLSVSGITIAAIFQWWRAADQGLSEAVAQIESADAARTISEELRRNLFTMRWKNGAETVLVGRGACAEVRYEVAEDVLHRRADAACGGGSRAISRHVAAFTRTTSGVETTFARHTGASSVPYRVTVAFSGGETP